MDGPGVLDKLKGWPLWAKIAVPAASVLALASFAGCGADSNPDPTPTTTTTATATTTTTTTVPVTSTTAAPIIAPLSTTPPTTVSAVNVPRSTAPPTTKPPTTQPAGVYYASCSEAKAAGAAPHRRGDPGYRSGLDRDGDGVACET